MPTFMDSLAANPQGSGIYGAVNPNQQMSDYTTNALSFVNHMKDREMQDFKDKALFMSDLSLRQDRLKRLYDPANNPNNQYASQQNQGMNTVMQQGMTPYEQGELGIRRQALEQQGKLGEERFGIQKGLSDIRSAQEQLNERKNQQIFENKMADMQRKSDESNAKLAQAQQKIQQAGDNFNARIEAEKSYRDAMEERHKTEMSIKQAQFDRLQEQHDRTIANQEKRTKQAERTNKTEKTNPEGTERETTYERGDAADRVQVTGRDGNTYMIPKDKLDDWNKNHSQEQEEQ